MAKERSLDWKLVNGRHPDANYKPLPPRPPGRKPMDGTLANAVRNMRHDQHIRVKPANPGSVRTLVYQINRQTVGRAFRSFQEKVKGRPEGDVIIVRVK